MAKNLKVVTPSATIQPANLRRFKVNNKAMDKVIINGKEYWQRALEIPINTSNWTLVTGGNDGSHTATITSGQIQLYSNWGNNGSYANASRAYAYTDVIDFSQYSTLTVHYNMLKTGDQYGTHGTAKIGILDGTSITVYNNNGCTEQGRNKWIWSQSYSTSGNDKAGTITYDISSVKQSARLFLLVYTYQTNAYLRTDSVVLT